jgi:hypothetical protein
MRADVRGRYAGDPTNPDGEVGTQNPSRSLPTQSGAFGGHEVEARELFLQYDGATYDVYVGRKFSLELAAVKFDGFEVQKRASKEWTYLGFAGLYPTRGSRNLADDYPRGLVDPTDPGRGRKRILPVTGGVGGAYRYESIYGALGAVGILPLARDQAVRGALEEPRVFATSHGYWRRSPKLDLFHDLVVDAMGAAGAGLTNLTLGLGYQPVAALRVNAQVTEVDTETLNVQAQTRLETPDPNVAGQLQNNIEVARVAQQAARLGLSVALRQQRFEISTSGTLRRRGAISVPLTGAAAGTFELSAGKAVDVLLSLVDRRSWNGFRVAATLVHSFGVGSRNLDRSKSTVARLEGTREIDGGRAELEVNLTYLTARDEGVGNTCAPGIETLETCYGASKVSSFTLGALAYYRFQPSWFVIGAATLGRQSLTSSYAAGAAIELPAISSVSAFLRLAYRF